MCHFEISLNHMALVEIISSGFWSSQRLSERRRPACRCIAHVSRAPRLPGLGTIFRRGLGFHRSLRGTQGLQHVVPPTTGRIPRGSQIPTKQSGNLPVTFLPDSSPHFLHGHNICAELFSIFVELCLNFLGRSKVKKFKKNSKLF